MDSNGLYNTKYAWFSWEPFLIFTGLQYSMQEVPNCRGQLHSTDDGSYAFHAIVFTFLQDPRLISLMLVYTSQFHAQFQVTCWASWGDMFNPTSASAHPDRGMAMVWFAFIELFLDTVLFRRCQAHHCIILQGWPISYWWCCLWCQILTNCCKFDMTTAMKICVATYRNF